MIFIGHQFRNAIAKYSAAGSGALQLPRELKDLVDDDRSPVPRHFLRKIYRDPMTGKDDWTPIRTNDGGIVGVASSSIAMPIKKANFDLADAGFENTECYCDWRFVYRIRFNRALRTTASHSAIPLNSSVFDGDASSSYSRGLIVGGQSNHGR